MTLTLIDGGARQTYAEHPVEIARKALLAAAEIEGLPESSTLRRIEAALPERGRTIKVNQPAGSAAPPMEAEHPIEIARKALFAAAEIEDKAGDYCWAGTLWTIADTLPDRGRRDRTRDAVKDEWATWREEMREAGAAWRGLSTERREGVLLKALGAATIGEC